MDSLIHHMLRASTLRFPEKEALVHREERLTYAEVSQRVAGLASGLCQAGLTRGERVAIYLDPSIPQVVSIFGVSQAGGVFVPINTLLFPEQLAHIARDCGVSALITSRQKLETLLTVLDTVPSIRFLVVVSDGQSADAPLPCHDYDSLTRAKSTRQ